MPLAATTSKISASGALTPRKSNTTRYYFSLWQLLPVMLVALMGFLTLTPDGIAEPMQDFAGWLVVGGVATLAVMAIVTGLDRLLDCEGN